MKAIIFFLLFVLLADINFGQSKYDEASEAIKNNDFHKALSIAQELLSKDSTDAAIKILVDLTTHDTTDKGGFESLGDAYNKMGVLELALQNYDHAERLDTLDTQIKFKIGEALYKQKSYTDAANKFLQIIAIDSTYSAAYLKVGEILYYAKQYPNAAFYLSKYLKFDQKNAKAYFFTANSFFLMHNYSSAAETAKQGLDNFPKQIELQRILALSLAFGKKYDDALKYLNATPDSLISGREFAQLGYEFMSGKMDSLAVMYFKKAMDKDSSLVGTLSEYTANLYFSSGKYDSAIVYYDKKLKIDSSSVSTHVNKALCMYQLKDYEGARVALLQAKQLKGDYLPTLEWLARTYQNLDSTQAMVDTYNQIIQVASNDSSSANKNKVLAEAYSSIAVSYLVKKKYAVAIEPLKNAMKYDPDNPQYHLWLAQAYALTLKKADAIREYKKVLQLDPKNPDAKKGLKILGE